MFAPRIAKSAAQDSAALSSLAGVRTVVKGPGHPLAPVLRTEMQQRLGWDFSHVRVHADATAGKSAQAVHARAYTVGSHVVFAPDQYAPATARGRELLAHELAHTVQQRAGANHGFSPGGNDALEASADAAASAVADGRSGVVPMPASGIGMARQPDDGADKSTTQATKTPSRFLPGGFTDEEMNRVTQEAENRQKLGLLALTLAERQARRREFWDHNPSYSDYEEALAFDLYWDPKQEGYIRQPYVDIVEAPVMADPEARRLYDDHLWDLTNNKPDEPSRFTRAIHFVCEHTEPCSSNIEQFRRDRESGMSRDEALNRGLARLAVVAETIALPTPGPRGPIALGKPAGALPPGAGGLPVEPTPSPQSEPAPKTPEQQPDSPKPRVRVGGFERPSERPPETPKDPVRVGGPNRPPERPPETPKDPVRVGGPNRPPERPPETPKDPVRVGGPNRPPERPPETPKDPVRVGGPNRPPERPPETPKDPVRVGGFTRPPERPPETPKDPVRVGGPNRPPERPPGTH